MSKLRSQLANLMASQDPKSDAGSIQYAANPSKESINQENCREQAEIQSGVQELAEKLFEIENWEIVKATERNAPQNRDRESGKQPAQSSVNAINPNALANTLTTLLRENSREQIAMLSRIDGQLEVLIKNARAVVSSASVETNANNGEAFERIEARISSLEKSVENLSLDSVQANKNLHMTDLMQMPGQLRSTLGSAEQLFHGQNKSCIVEELQPIAARVGSIDPAQTKASGETHNLQLIALEKQIPSIAAQLQPIGAQPNLSFIKSRLGSIEEQFAAIRDAA